MKMIEVLVPQSHAHLCTFHVLHLDVAHTLSPSLATNRLRSLDDLQLQWGTEISTQMRIDIVR